jgi:hypothetical protein
MEWTVGQLSVMTRSDVAMYVCVWGGVHLHGMEAKLFESKEIKNLGVSVIR